MPVDKFYKTLFSKESRDKLAFELKVQLIYKKVSAIAGDPQYSLAFRCYAEQTGPCASRK